jgi:glutamine amidotransferase of anthranilate synthase or aminodeoxychorismate synthase
MFLMIDNYDSFVFNLVRYFKELDQKIEVYRNDKITLEDIWKLKPQGIIISPGPKNPLQAGISTEIFKHFKGEIPILGICLGHQCFAHSLGGRIIKAKEPVHGKISKIEHDGLGLFRGLKNPINVTRYHSLIVDKNSLPSNLQITCTTDDGIIMGLRHRDYLIETLQFHPEAELTECGHEMLRNFIEMTKVL